MDGKTNGATAVVAHSVTETFSASADVVASPWRAADATSTARRASLRCSHQNEYRGCVPTSETRTIMSAETVADRGRGTGDRRGSRESGSGKAAISSSHSRSEPLVQSSSASGARAGAWASSGEGAGVGSMLSEESGMG